MMDPRDLKQLLYRVQGRPRPEAAPPTRPFEYGTPPIWARITGPAGGVTGRGYPWTQVWDGDNTFPTGSTSGFYQSGNETTWPAFDVNGGTTNITGTKVQLWPSPNGEFWIFNGTETCCGFVADYYTWHNLSFTLILPFELDVNGIMGISGGIGGTGLGAWSLPYPGAGWLVDAGIKVNLISDQDFENNPTNVSLCVTAGLGLEIIPGAVYAGLAGGLPVLQGQFVNGRSYGDAISSVSDPQSSGSETHFHPPGQINHLLFEPQWSGQASTKFRTTHLSGLRIFWSVLINQQFGESWSGWVHIQGGLGRGWLTATRLCCGTPPASPGGVIAAPGSGRIPVFSPAGKLATSRRRRGSETRRRQSSWFQQINGTILGRV